MGALSWVCAGGGGDAGKRRVVLCHLDTYCCAPSDGSVWDGGPGELRSPGFSHMRHFLIFFKYEAKPIGLMQTLGHQMGSAPLARPPSQWVVPSSVLAVGAYLHVSISHRW